MLHVCSFFVSSVNAGVWEDTDYIKSSTESGVFDKPECERVVRAVVGQIKPKDRVLIVTSADMRLVFDDLDSWFVDQCAQIVNNA